MFAGRAAPGAMAGVALITQSELDRIRKQVPAPRGGPARRLSWSFIWTVEPSNCLCARVETPSPPRAGPSFCLTLPACDAGLRRRRLWPSGGGEPDGFWVRLFPVRVSLSLISRFGSPFVCAPLPGHAGGQVGRPPPEGEVKDAERHARAGMAKHNRGDPNRPGPHALRRNTNSRALRRNTNSRAPLRFAPPSPEPPPSAPSPRPRPSAPARSVPSRSASSQRRRSGRSWTWLRPSSRPSGGPRRWTGPTR